MKILLYSSVFWPSLGGVETITATLAENIVRLGQECIVVTETASEQEDNRSYRVVRQPKLRERFELTRQCDLVHSNGASIAMFPFAKLNNKPFIWTHNGYQVSCVDGLGWVDGEPAPMTPLPSLIYHLKKKGLIHFLREFIKLGIRRYVAAQVDLNIAATEWVAKRQPLKNQIVSYTPYPLNQFKLSKSKLSKKYDFIYVGRLVSEKGVPDLINAFHLLLSSPNGRGKKLAIVGEGNIKPDLEKLVAKLKITDNVFFLGSQYGKDLLEIMAQSQIAVVPSVWEEPMGGVALELLAAGKNIIVSEFGGHAECVGNAGLKFKNGDYQSLYECMIKLMTDESLAKEQLENASLQVKLFDEMNLTKKYVDIYQSLLNHKPIQKNI
ncbi:glycosyltransferase family 4 protein [Allocoleopsis franciscana]|uniref:Glycosyltransferase n=1 Tax=Allocoleopsis franciscana PCC 7113 TaxID=1173027 RepID=K9WLV2_9CYAN|nr:glycosyltransferase family 4 protein [Allocoleopsis franciscana]AFZ21390.1 glycosyltransferase [Allocoleopsis franciscana PCC 7113]